LAYGAEPETFAAAEKRLRAFYASKIPALTDRPQQNVWPFQINGLGQRLAWKARPVKFRKSDWHPFPEFSQAG
jgi:hypothetical protein